MTHLAPRRPRLAIAGGTLAVLTATLAAAGAFRHIDQYAVDHLMPWLQVRHHPLATVQSLTLPTLDGPAANVALELWTYPATVLPSLLLVLAAAIRLARADAVVCWVLWCAGNAIEVVGKETLHEPALYLHGVHVTEFDMSLPSGHTIRAFVVACAIAAAWRNGGFAYVWAATVPLALIVSGAHTPSDVTCGTFAAVLLVAWAPHQKRRLPTARPASTVS